MRCCIRNLCFVLQVYIEIEAEHKEVDKPSIEAVSFSFFGCPGSTDRGQSLSLIHCRGSIISTGNRDWVVFSFLRALMGSSLTIPSKQVTACLLEAGAKIDASRDNQGMLSLGLGWMFLDKLPSLKLT